MKHYGQPDLDTTPLDALLAHLKHKQIDYILHHQRIPIDARPCRLPLSLRVQAILKDGTVWTALQDRPNGKITITKGN